MQINFEIIECTCLLISLFYFIIVHSIEYTKANKYIQYIENLGIHLKKLHVNLKFLINFLIKKD